jgi:hypothetical protein
MTFPTGTTISTENVDSPDDDPSLARSDIYNLIVAVNAIIASANQNQGVVLLDSGGRINSARLPGNLAPTGTLNLQPSTGVVNVQNVLRLAQLFSEDLGTVSGTQSPSAGDVCYLTDGDAGQPCVAVYDGTQWRVLRLMTSAGSALITFTLDSTLTAEADA